VLAGAFDPDTPPTPRRTPRDRARLTHAQLSIWLAEQIRPRSCLHNESAAFRLTGPLDAERLVRALVEAAGGHEALRCRVAEAPAGGDEPVLVFADADGTPTPVDVVVLDDARQLAAAIAAAVAVPFDLAVAPLARGTLFRLGADEHVLLVVAHHLVIDAWGFGVLLEDVAARYDAPAAGSPGSAGTPATTGFASFADFADWERSAFAADRHLGYWRERLAAPLPPLAFPSADARGPRVGGRGATAGRLRSVRVPADVSTRLSTLARENATSLSALLLTAYCTVVARCTGQYALDVGIPVAVRNQPGLARLVGPLLNVIVHRCVLDPDADFASALRHTAAAFKEDLRHRDTPWELVRREIGAAWNRAGAAQAFQLLFAFHSGPDTILRLPGVRVERIASHSGAAKYDLSLFAHRSPTGELELSLEHRTSVLDDASAADLARSLLCLLHAVAEHTDRTQARP